MAWTGEPALRPRTIAVTILCAALAGSALVIHRTAQAQVRSQEGKPLPLVVLPGRHADRWEEPPDWVWRPSFRAIAEAYEGAEAERREGEFLAYAEAEARAYRQGGQLLGVCFGRAREYLWALGPLQAHVSFCLAACGQDEWFFVFVLYPFRSGPAAAEPYPVKVAVNTYTLRPRLW